MSSSSVQHNSTDQHCTQQEPTTEPTNAKRAGVLPALLGHVRVLGGLAGYALRDAGRVLLVLLVEGRVAVQRRGVEVHAEGALLDARLRKLVPLADARRAIALQRAEVFAIASVLGVPSLPPRR